MKKPILALKPLKAEGNSFSGLFSSHIDGEAFQCVGFEWEKLGRGVYDVVLFHWPTEFFRPESRKATLKLLGRMLKDKLRHGTKFVWVAHNLEPHDGGNMRSALTTRLFLGLLDGVILLSNYSRNELYRLYPASRRIASLVTVHGRYMPLAAEPKEVIPAERRNRLLFFGMIRAYKNVECLVAEARKVKAVPFSLTVTGVCFDVALRERIVAAAAGDPRIMLDLRDTFLPDAELEEMIDAHDAVVLPYRNILNSGVALHALGRNKPILAPAIGSLPELQAMVGSDWVHLFEGEIAAATLEGFFADLERCTAPRPDLGAFDWERVGADVTRFLQSLSKRR
jgi:glycosyltransferase involved in cell wall biosynthesis